MINPDGVFRGFWRSDTNGENLNRTYLNPTLVDHPATYAIKEILMSYHREDRDRLYCYLDLHGHGSKRGLFFYGNYMDYTKTIESMLFAKLVELNDPNFDFEG